MAKKYVDEGIQQGMEKVCTTLGFRISVTIVPPTQLFLIFLNWYRTIQSPKSLNLPIGGAIEIFQFLEKITEVKKRNDKLLSENSNIIPNNSINNDDCDKIKGTQQEDNNNKQIPQSPKTENNVA